MVSKRRCGWMLLLNAIICAAVAGCTPALVKPAATIGKATVIADGTGAYAQLSSAVSRSSVEPRCAGEYQAHWMAAGFQHEVSISAIVRERKMLVQASADGIGFHFYQDGSAAYVDQQGTWVSATPLPTTNLFAGYRSVVQQAMKQHVALRLLPEQFLGGEENQVLQMRVPSAWLSSSVSSAVQSQPTATAGKVVVTLYVGRRSHLLRYVETSAASADADGYVNVSITTDVEFYYDAAHTVLQPPVR